jgi:hypothetical protein
MKGSLTKEKRPAKAATICGKMLLLLSISFSLTIFKFLFFFVFKKNLGLSSDPHTVAEELRAKVTFFFCSIEYCFRLKDKKMMALDR